ncbi:signal recognition particle, SRP9/SRP14 subunit [Dichomitus squalens]|uniref:Signal recognition particle subunit SRP14 n=1 Tax=Dichomitus squalens TaxID=114155 RepID=A0A4Q9MLJ7_9APHY|nr:signal recognition particle, SRP9/SRP14 subunit [Dichomitus squalens]TBU39851.1 signal recognition particle, SRP9/SRP14 subunit [Dichomitus squalens]
MQLVDNETFLTQVSTLFESSAKSRSIWLTHKRLLHEGGDAHISSEGDNIKEYPCLVRVSDGDNSKFSTIVKPADLEKFHAAYGTLLRASMSTLRKRDKKREKQRQEDAARKKRRLQEEIAIEGPKRGAGRRRRQRKMKQAAKLEESKKRAQEREEAKARAKAS